MRGWHWGSVLAAAAGAVMVLSHGTGYRPTGAAHAAQAEIPWLPTFEAGAALAKQHGKPLFVVFR
ncbi:MAG: hypothetical protein FJX77_04155 [Armatimonadetes bacterium]|nr:hypothetical protein [Armatimonadota bacterium]